jgi:hypothetical protein
MKNRIIFLLSFISSVTVLLGCGTIYSPTLNLPHEPLIKDEGQLTGTLSALPQNGTGDLEIAGSGEGQINYAFSDRFSLQAKAWSQASELYQLHYNGGTSISATYLLNSRESVLPIGLIGSSSMLIEGRSIKANGGSLQIAGWIPEMGIFRPYLAAGGGIMVANFKTQDWGYGSIINVGTSLRFSEHLYSNIEVYGIVQRYIHYHAIAGFLAPSISISWKFNNN